MPKKIITKAIRTCWSSLCYARNFWEDVSEDEIAPTIAPDYLNSSLQCLRESPVKKETSKWEKLPKRKIERGSLSFGAYLCGAAWKRRVCRPCRKWNHSPTQSVRVYCFQHNFIKFLKCHFPTPKHIYYFSDECAANTKIERISSFWATFRKTLMSQQNGILLQQLMEKDLVMGLQGL